MFENTKMDHHELLKLYLAHY